MASITVTAGLGSAQVNVHACEGQVAVSLECVRAYPTYGTVTIDVGDVTIVRFVADADQLRAEAAALTRAALELDLASHAATIPPPAVVAAGDAACEAAAVVEGAVVGA